MSTTAAQGPHLDDSGISSDFGGDVNRSSPNSSLISNSASKILDDGSVAESRTPTMEELQKAAGAPGIVGSEPIPAKSLVIKTKKPRPYACPTCTRSFARLEHLKRHERSHTKEKPFQCPICERSFARRDLLLRHKQKLHASFSPTDEKSSSKESSVNSQSQQPQQQDNLSKQLDQEQPSHDIHHQHHHQSPHLSHQQQHHQLHHPAGQPLGLDQQGLNQPQSSQMHMYRSSHMVGRQSLSAGPRLRSNGPPGSNSSSSSPLGGNPAQQQQQQQQHKPRHMHGFEGLDLLTPLKSASPTTSGRGSVSFPFYSSSPSETNNNNGGQFGFSQQVAFPGGTPVNPQGLPSNNGMGSNPASSNLSAQLNSAGTQNGNAASAGHSQFNQGGYHPNMYTEWKQLNPLAHELEIMQGSGVAPPFRVASRNSRASSFSAASATSYVRQKDIDQVAPTSSQFAQGPTEVGFATPQAYAIDDGPYDFEPLDLNFVSPAQLSQPPPRKRRVSVSTSNPNISASPQSDSYVVSIPMNNNGFANVNNNIANSTDSPQAGPAVQALRAQVRSQRQFYTLLGSGGGIADSSSSINSMESPDAMGSQGSSSYQQQHSMSPSQQGNHMQHLQQKQHSQQQQQGKPPYAAKQNNTPSHNPQYWQQERTPQSHSQHSHIPIKEASLAGKRQSMDSFASNDYGSFNDFGQSPTSAFTPSMTPGFTPGFTPSLHAPMGGKSSMSPLSEETGDIRDFLAQQNEEFVNSLFDAEGETSGFKSSYTEPSSIAASMMRLNKNAVNITNSNDTNHNNNNNINNININNNNNNKTNGTLAGSYNSLNANATDATGNTNNSDHGAQPTLNGEADRLQRYIDAYFSSFDTHLSFVHRSSQSIPNNPSGISSTIGSPAISPPSSSSSVATNDGSSDAKALSHAQAAMGAQMLGERGEAHAYYWAARDHTNSTAGGLESLQADLLVSILGLFIDEPSEHAISFDRLAMATADAELYITQPSKNSISTFISSPNASEFGSTNDFGLDWPSSADRLWSQFIANQSRIRTLHALHAVCCWVRRPSEHLLNVLKNATCTPCDDDLWRAPTCDIWLRLLASKGLDARMVVETGGSQANQFSYFLSKLRAGEVPNEDVSQFTLQSLLFALEVPQFVQDSPSGTNMVSSRAALRAWETLWARSPDASLDPSPFSGPIMSDCVGIVSLVAFTPLKLAGVLDAVWKHDFPQVTIEIKNAVNRLQHGLSTVANYAVDTLVWCEGHVTSCSIFFTTLLAVTECGLVLSESLRHITSKNTPLAPSEEQLIERSQKLVSSILKVTPTSDPSSLPNGVLKATVCLVRLSDWPLVGALSRTLLTQIA